MSQAMIKDAIPRDELLDSGHLACPGCGAPIAMRLVLKALGPKTIVVLPACCWSIIAGPFPQSSLKVPLFHTAFETGGAVASQLTLARAVARQMSRPGSAQRTSSSRSVGAGQLVSVPM